MKLNDPVRFQLFPVKTCNSLFSKVRAFENLTHAQVIDRDNLQYLSLGLAVRRNCKFCRHGLSCCTASVFCLSMGINLEFMMNYLVNKFGSFMKNDHVL